MNTTHSHHDRRTAAVRDLLVRWGAEAVRRDYPRQVTRRDGYRYARAGKWFVTIAGCEVAATAAQARQLNATGVGGPYAGVRITRD